MGRYIKKTGQTTPVNAVVENTWSGSTVNAPSVAMVQDALVGENMLINSDFKSGLINQQGKTEYIGTNEYTYGFDMWRQIGYIKMSNIQGGVRVESITGNNGEVYFEQLVSGSVSEKVTFTIAVKNVSGDVTVAIKKNDTYEALDITEPGIYSITREDGADSVSIQLTGTTSYIEVEYMKLEKGSHFTGMPVWNEGLELLKCMRYYQPLYVLAHRNSESGNNLYYSIDTMFPVPMAKSPTVNVTKVYTPNGDDITSSTTVDDIGVSYRNVGTVHFGEEHGYIMLKIDLILDAYHY